MLQRLTINLSEPEQRALEEIAATELRDTRDQARFILREGLTRRGLLPVDNLPEPIKVDHDKEYRIETADKQREANAGQPRGPE